MSQIQIAKFDTLTKIVEQLKGSGYECEASTLNNNVAFVALEQMAEKEASAIAEAIKSKTLRRYDCKNCGKDTHSANANYCTSCGTKIEIN